MKSSPLGKSAILPALALLCCAFCFPEAAHSEPRALVAARVAVLPAPESPDDPAWAGASPVTVLDAAAHVPITLRALHDGRTVSIQAGFPDTNEDREHRTLRWDPAARAYADGPEREDMLLLKWSMSGSDAGLTLAEDAPYAADEWCWRAGRTDGSGHADDRVQTYSLHPDPYAKALVSRGGRVFYLSRQGDAGKDPAAPLLYPGFAGDKAPKYALSAPDGSRADVRARGYWRDGAWTVTFQRALDTGNEDDVAFEASGAHAFGVSRFETAGGPPEPGSREPLFNCGEVGEILLLRFGGG